jgi:hypothetical protein
MEVNDRGFLGTDEHGFSNGCFVRATNKKYGCHGFGYPNRHTALD